MKNLLVAVSIAMSHAIATAETYSVEGKPSTKVEAVKALLRNSSTDVQRCNRVTLTDKVTLKNIPKAKK